MLDFKHTDRTRREFESLSLDHLDALFSAGLRLTKNERDAEDLVQDTFLRAFRFFDKFERGTNMKAWLFKILTNTFINKYRRRVKERTVVEGASREAGNERFVTREPTESSADPEQYFFDKLLSDDVIRSIDQLPIDFRLVVILADLQEFSMEGTAEILDCPVGTVMSRLYRGRHGRVAALPPACGLAERPPLVRPGYGRRRPEAGDRAPCSGRDTTRSA